MINYLPQSMSQEELRQLFGIMGALKSCKLVMDKTTGKSLGYAFVNYASAEDANRAVLSLNGYKIQDKCIKVAYACAPGGQSNLYVTGFPDTLTAQEFEQLFEPYGKISTSRLLTDKVTGVSLCSGFIRYQKREEAELAITALNGSSPFRSHGPLQVKYANVHQKNSPSTPQFVPQIASLPTQYVIPPNGFQTAHGVVPNFNLPPPAQLAPATGPVHRVAVNQNHRFSPITPNGVARTGGFGAALRQNLGSSNASTTNGSVVVNSTYSPPAFTNNSTSDVHMQAFNGQGAPAMPVVEVAAQTVFPIQPAVSVINNDAATKTVVPIYSLYVGHIDPEVDQIELSLWKLFGPLGTVHSIKVMNDFTTNKCKGYAFVNMLTCEGALAAIGTLHGQPFGSKVLQVSLKSQKMSDH
uniref:RRM domain-containing protein n=1 Tax=Ditylenchus dipsaci TaxID=166011 RepID=A0A915DII4_9BILA